MYKKITHHITEEHYDHPMAAAVKKSVETGTAVKPKSIYVVEEPSMASLNQFEKDNIYAWSELAEILNNLVVSISSSSADTAYLVAQATSDIDAIGKLLEPIATPDQIVQFKKALTSWATALMAVVSDTVAGADTQENTAKLTSIIAAIAAFLYSLQPTWDSTVVTKILTDVSNLYVEQARARLNSDWSGSWAAANGAYKILVTGQADGTPGLADIFASGITGC